MISFDAPIISGHSIGNVILGDNIDSYYRDFLAKEIYPNKYRLGQIDCFRFHIPEILEVFFNDDNIVFAVTALNEYQSNYQNMLFPDMTIGEVKKIDSLRLDATECFIDLIDEVAIKKPNMQGLIRGLSVVLTENKEIYDDFNEFPNDFKVWGIMVFNLKFVL